MAIVAKQVGILESSESRWDEALTRSEGIEFIVNALKNDDSIPTFNYNQGEITGYDVSDTQGEVITEAKPEGSMGQYTGEEIQSEDFIVEDMDATTMYVIATTDLMSGPDMEDFENLGAIWETESVSVVGVVNSYKGEVCKWYRISTGEFINSECVSSEAPVIEEVEPTPEVTPAPEVQQPEVQEPAVQEPVVTPEPQPEQQPETTPEPDLGDLLDMISGDGNYSGDNTGNTESTTADGRPFYTGNPDWQGGGAAPDGTW